MHAFLGRGPISAHANAISTKPQKFVQLGAAKVAQTIWFIKNKKANKTISQLYKLRFGNEMLCRFVFL